MFKIIYLVKLNLTEISDKAYLAVYICKAIVAVISVIKKTNVIKNPQAPLQVANSKESKTWNPL